MLASMSPCVRRAHLRAAATLLSITATGFAIHAQTSPALRKHNVIIFVADGLRRNSVNPADMPTFYKVRTEGVDFQNSHSAFPSFTTANASVIATGHNLGDTGDFSNVIYPGAFLPAKPGGSNSAGTVAPFLESDDVLAGLNALNSGNYLGETTLLSFARAHGYSVASVGKVGPTAIQQVDAVRWQGNGNVVPETIIIDDQTGQPAGVPLPEGLAQAMRSARLDPNAPNRSNGFPKTRFDNGYGGDAQTAGTDLANVVQSQWFNDVTTRVILPQFAASGRPFVLLFWSRDPDGTQHNNGDSFNDAGGSYGLAPGINGLTSQQALRNADHSLAQIMAWLDAHSDLKATTDILITSDHGFATISRRELDAEGNRSSSPSKTPSNEPHGSEVPQPAGTLPNGFVAMDLARALGVRLFDATTAGPGSDSPFPELRLDASPQPHPSTGSALLAMPGKSVRQLDGKDAQMIVASNGGSDLIYVPSGDPAIIKRTIGLLSGFDYVAGIWADDHTCPHRDSCPGALPLSTIGLQGSTHLPTPAIVVNLKVFYPRPDLQSAIQISDTMLQEGQGMHGGFGRESTWNNMAAIGPDFRSHFVDTAPVGNIDIAPTLASILGLDLPSHGTLRGRVASEAFRSSTPASAQAKSGTLVSAPAHNGRRTVLEYQDLNGVRYGDRGCMVEGKAKDVCPGHF